jgi:hypothetical protein
MIRFRHADSLPSLAVGDSLVEVVLVNSSKMIPTPPTQTR